MVQQWLSIKVELVHHNGEDPWPRPGRRFIVGPRHTFAQLGEAIDVAFARWDRSRESAFTLADGTSVDGTSELPVGDVVELGAEFRYVFSLDDWWVHRCEVATLHIEPRQARNDASDQLVPYDGWGEVPDQFRRQWEDDEGTAGPPARPAGPDPMTQRSWPDTAGTREPLDLAKVRRAIAARDGTAIVDAVRDRDVRPALQTVGDAMVIALEDGGPDVRDIAAHVVEQLRDRSWEGDEELADELDAMLRGEAPPKQVLPIDLGELADLLEGDPSMDAGGYIDLHTGDVIHASIYDSSGLEEMGIDIEEEPDRWLGVRCFGSSDGWQDMAAFAADITDGRLRRRLEDAIEGRGAFRRFKDAVHDEGIAEQWFAFSGERQVGRARSWLSGEGIHARPARRH